MVGDDEAKVRAERARAIGLFRYQLIREAADPVHSTRERGRMVCQVPIFVEAERAFRFQAAVAAGCCS
jgi:hypothetical protein